MQEPEYAVYYGSACVVFSLYLLAKGFIAASRQRSEDESTTLVPAYVYGILSSVILTVGLGFFKPSLPWWGYRMIFPGTTMFFPAIIYLIGRRSSKPRLDRADA
jgi:cyanate permease